MQKRSTWILHTWLDPSKKSTPNPLKRRPGFFFRSQPQNDFYTCDGPSPIFVPHTSFSKTSVEQAGVRSDKITIVEKQYLQKKTKRGKK